MITRPHGVCSLGLIGLLSACQSSAEKPLRVFAASSLTDVMAELALVFEVQHPEHQVVLSTGGSHILRFQIENGAEAQIFASASPEDVMT
ncbi:MAG: substrate-binding domain-containing protein, partial [Myxococcota bacterium]|nr:substrate-binding domain-containing protein [Myxococcota bacterium]